MRQDNQNQIVKAWEKSNLENEIKWCACGCGQPEQHCIGKVDIDKLPAIRIQDTRTVNTFNDGAKN